MNLSKEKNITSAKIWSATYNKILLNKLRNKLGDKQNYKKVDFNGMLAKVQELTTQNKRFYTNHDYAFVETILQHCQSFGYVDTSDYELNLIDQAMSELVIDAIEKREKALMKIIHNSAVPDSYPWKQGARYEGTSTNLIKTDVYDEYLRNLSALIEDYTDYAPIPTKGNSKPAEVLIEH